MVKVDVGQARTEEVQRVETLHRSRRNARSHNLIPVVKEDVVASKKKMTLYFSEEIINETKQEALRQDRSLSWIMEVAWKIARERLQGMPGVDEFVDDFEDAA